MYDNEPIGLWLQDNKGRIEYGYCHKNCKYPCPGYGAEDLNDGQEIEVGISSWQACGVDIDKRVLGPSQTDEVVNSLDK